MAILVGAIATSAHPQQPGPQLPERNGRPPTPAALDQPANLHVADLPLADALSRLHQSSQVSIFFSPSRLPAELRVTCSCSTLDVRGALETMLANTPFDFREIDGYVFLVDRDEWTPERGRRPGEAPRDSARLDSSVDGGSSPPRRAGSQRTGTLSGRVTGVDDRPLAGARVILDRARRSTETGADGRFSFSDVPLGDHTLSASYPGYSELRRTTVVPEGPPGEIMLRLTSVAMELEGVVAVGYGTARRRDLTGAIGSVPISQSLVAAHPSVSHLLQGRVAGVLVTQNNGAPGGGVTIRVRGTSSISAASEPLYVIDGVPAFSSPRGNDPSLNPLAVINPSDIESVEVLKDASSTAIYGARGAPGVVLITTKRGRRGVDQVTLDSSYGMQLPARYLRMIDGPQFASVIREARANAGLPLISPLTGEAYSEEEFDSLAAAGPGTDWQQLVLRRAPLQSHTITFSGGDDRNRFLVSGGLFDQQGIVIGSDFSRVSGRVSFDRILSRALQVGTTLAISHIEQHVQRTDNGLTSGAVMSALWFNPLAGPRLEDGSWRMFSPVTWPTTNPLPGALDDLNRQRTLTVVGSVGTDLTLSPGLRLRSSLGLASGANRSESYARSTSPDGRTSRGAGNVVSTSTMNLTHENILSHRSDWDAGNLELTGGFTVQSSRTERLEASNEQFANDLTGAWDLGAGTRPSSDTDYTSWGLVSFLSRAALNIRDTYLLTITGRSDGSSRFGRNSKWAFFPSAAFAWRLVGGAPGDRRAAVDDLKLRVSYGVTGNQEIGVYHSLERLVPVQGSVGGQPVVGYANAGMAPNPDLKWETTEQYNLGVDFALLGSRISGALDVYHSVTDDLLLAVSLPRSSGFSSQLRNVGSVRNDGVELSLGTTNLARRNTFWRSTLTLAHNRNEVVALGVSSSLPVANQKGINVQTGQDVLVMRVGQPLGTFVGKRTVGLYQQGDACPLTVRRPTLDCVPGEYRYVDANGDGAINSNDNVILGNGQPDFHGGLGNNFGLGRFELNTFLQFAYGAEVMNAPAINTKQVNAFSNQTVDALARWTPTNTNTTVPRANANRPRELYDVHIEDGSFLRLQSVTLGYGVPEGLLPGAKSARVYIAGQNLGVWTKYSGFDPEVNSFGGDATAPGVDAGSYPRARSWTLGVNVVF